MNPLQDKDLDRLSREAAEHFEVEPGASGWANLEKRLDLELPQKKKKRRFLFWLFFITITTGGALIGIMKYQPVNPLDKNVPGAVTPAGNSVPATTNTPANTNSRAGGSIADAGNATGGDNRQPLSSSQTATHSQPVSEAPTPLNTLPGNTKTPTQDNDHPAPANKLNTTPGKSTVPGLKNDKNTKTRTGINKQGADKTPLSLNYATITPDKPVNVAAPVTKHSKRKPAAGRRQGAITGQYKGTVKPGIDKTTEPDTRVTADEQPANANEPEQRNNDQSAAQQVTTAADTVKKEPETPVQADTAKTAATPVVKKEKDNKQDKKVKGLELGLMAGPDLTTANFGPIYKTGYNFGLQVGYRLSNRWSVNTGIIYTKKFYKADSQDFHYKMPWNYKLTNVEGNCSMWEIPVNVRYDFSYNDKRRWFASTGLSTYLMDKEYYNIYYTHNGIPYDPYDIDSDSNSNYLFSIWNLSAGMERSLGKHFSIQAEPYLKIPLKGLGTGSMRMTSYGVLFTLKYKPAFNKKRSDTRK